jgi:Lipoate-protein ligase A
MGADAQLRGRNDIVVDGKKFSGMTMFKVGDSYAAGGTLMFDLDMNMASNVLTPEQDKMESKGVKSVNARITNIKNYLDEPFKSMDASQFKLELLKRIFKVDKLEDIETYKLNDHDWEVIDSRLKDKYDTDAWNYGKNPGFTNYVSKHFDIGTVAFNFSVNDGKISAIKLYGDFITGGDITLIEKALTDVNFDKDSLIKALKTVDLKANLGDIEPELLADLLLSK